MIKKFEEFHTINESNDAIKHEFDIVHKYLGEKKILIDNSGYKGDGNKSVATSDCDFFFDVSKKQFKEVNAHLEKLSDREDLKYDYRNLEGKSENEDHPLVRLKFKVD